MSPSGFGQQPLDEDITMVLALEELIVQPENKQKKWQIKKIAHCYIVQDILP